MPDVSINQWRRFTISEMPSVCPAVHLCEEGTTSFQGKATFLTYIVIFASYEFSPIFVILFTRELKNYSWNFRAHRFSAQCVKF
jgi:hypothetical protein